MRHGFPCRYCTLLHGRHVTARLARRIAFRSRSEQGGDNVLGVEPLPRPGDRSPGFMAEPGRCWALVYSRQLQSTHCQEAPAYTGRWFTPKGDKWFRVWACHEHLEGLTGIRQFGGSRS